MKKIGPILAQDAPIAIGPYSHAFKFENLVFTSGQLGIDPLTSNLAGPTIREQTVQCFSNLRAVLNEAGSGLCNIIKITVFLKSMKNFPEVNEIYKQFVSTDYPARTCVEVSKLPLDALVEIEAIAYCESN